MARCDEQAWHAEAVGVMRVRVRGSMRMMEHRRALVIVWLLGSALLAGCGAQTDAASAGPGAAAFGGSASSLDDLGERVWQAVVVGDSAALARLRLSEAQHNDTVWLEMPASDPGIGFPVDLAWLNIESRNRAALEAVLSRYAESSLQPIGTTCDSVRSHASFTVHSRCTVALRDGASGERHELELFRHALERDGGWKVVRYYDPAD